MARELDPKNPKLPAPDVDIEIISGIYDAMLDDDLDKKGKPRKPKPAAPAVVNAPEPVETASEAK